MVLRTPLADALIIKDSPRKIYEIMNADKCLLMVKTKILILIFELLEHLPTIYTVYFKCSQTCVSGHLY